MSWLVGRSLPTSLRLSSSPVSVTLSLPSFSPCQPQLSLPVHLALPQCLFSFSSSVCWGASKSGTSSCPNTDGPPLCVYMGKTPLSSLLISCQLLSQPDVSTTVTIAPRKERAEEGEVQGRQIYIYIYIYIHIHTHTHTHIYIYTHIYISVCVSLHYTTSLIKKT